MDIPLAPSEWMERSFGIILPVIEEKNIRNSDALFRFSLLIPGNDNIRFQLAGTKAIHTMKFTRDGKLATRARHEFKMTTLAHFGQCLPEPSPARDFIENNTQENAYFYGSVTGTSDFVARFSPGQLQLKKWE